jgi:hypothetical protein
MKMKKAFNKYVAIPFACASAAAGGMAAIVVFNEITGFRGRDQPSATPVPFMEAWTNLPLLAGLIFIGTFLVVAIWAALRWR